MDNSLYDDTFLKVPTLLQILFFFSFYKVFSLLLCLYFLQFYSSYVWEDEIW